MSAAARAQIEGCEDPATLDRWIARATTAASADKVIASAATPRS